MSEIVKLLIPSYKRAGRVHTLGGVANAALLVSSEEAAEYREHYPDVEVIEHPIGRGYAPTVQWALEKFKNVFFLDDDLRGMYRKYMEAGSDIPAFVERDQAYHIIQSTAETAKEMGAYLFGFSAIPNPLTYHGFTTFRYTGFVCSGFTGILEGGGLYFEQSVTGVVDFWLCLYNAYRNRYCLVDERFCFVDKERTFENRGGVAEFRNLETEEEDYRRLKVAFGDAIVIKEQGPIHVRKNVNPWEKTIMLPY